MTKVLTTGIKIIQLNDGNVLHALKRTDEGFNSFGEAYFSMVKCGSIKAWKLHTKMTMNLVVPIGEVKFVFLSDNNFFEITLSKDNYKRITVPPNIWFGFMGIAVCDSLILNIADIIHDVNEVKRKKLNEIDYDWSIK